jgi:enolase
MISAMPPTRVSRGRGRARRSLGGPGARLQEGWVLANHILVSFHAAFISSVLALPALEISKSEVLEFIFLSAETVVSALFVVATFHVAVAFHEMGHFLTAARLSALNESIAGAVQEQLGRGGLSRWLYLVKVFLLAPWGRAVGIKREGLNYYPDAPYNLAVAAAGPRASRNVAMLTLPPAVALLALGLSTSSLPAIYLGRLLLGIGIVTGLDFLIADRGKYREFRERERKARQAAEALAPSEGWAARAAQAKQRLIEQRMQEVVHPKLGPVRAPWQFRNCGMGGRHTEKEYPESNISMQEAMFLIVGARNYLDAQEMTIALQTRLKEIIENAEGCRVMGIGLEGGLAPYIDPGEYPLPEVRLWVMMKQAIAECGYAPGDDVAIALDPAMSELETAYRKEFGVPDSVGMYLFWRDERKVVLDRDGVLELFDRTIREFEVPLLSIEDGFSENDHEGWKQLNQKQGERLLIIGDDLVTTNDATIERAADRGLINAALIKANQIGTLHETVLAMLVALGKGLDLVVSHRSKSPNDDMEAHIALATNALGLKAGGGANTERLMKYHAVATQIAQVERGGSASRAIEHGASVADLFANEEPTNAGIPTVGVEVEVTLSDGGVQLAFRGATPLGTSAGTGEAVHLVDGVFEGAEHAETLASHRELFEEVERGVFAFRKEVTSSQIQEKRDDALAQLFTRSRRYQGKGCLNAVDNVREVIAPYFRGRDLAGASFLDLDRALLQLERRTAERRGKLEQRSGDAIVLMQRKQNLGMNAVLSVSLALARAIAFVRGRQLWELMREEMVGVIEKLANTHGVPIGGSRWEDYVATLRGVTRVLERNGVPLHQELRGLTRVYEDPKLPPPSSLPLARPRAQRQTPVESALTAAPPPTPVPAATISAAPPRPAEVEVALGEVQQQALQQISLALHRSYVLGEDAHERCDALRNYICFRTETMRSVRPFEILNNKIVRDGERLLVPYLAGGGLLTHIAHRGRVEVEHRRLRRGTIVTDALLAAMTGVHGEMIDLEEDLFGYDVISAPEVRVSRIRDMAALLQELDKTANYYRAAIYLRCLVVRLCGRSFHGFLSAKNLLPEVRQLDAEFVKVLNGPFAERLKLPMRVLVRNVSALLIRPNLIDQLWSDAIDLAEVQVRGSQIANELRRSSHHALGATTLDIASAYHQYLQTGTFDGLRQLGFAEASEADERARRQTAARALVERILNNLEKLLGKSEILGRIREWQDAYAEALVRCEFGNVLDEELEAVVNGGIRARNRWVFRHHLRILGRKAEDVASLLDGSDPRRELQALEVLDPAEQGFDAAQTETAVTELVKRLTRTLRERSQDPLFHALDAALSAFGRGAFLDTIRRIARLRGEVDELIERGGFREQRYLLFQLDCLLEEMGYLAIRNIASLYEKQGVLLDECFEIVHTAAANLVHGGLRSDELCELASMLRTPGRSEAELLNVLDALQDCYHRVVHRNSLSYEALGQRLNLSADELRIVLADLQRYMHDLNSIAHLCDLAKRQIRARLDAVSPDAIASRHVAPAPELTPFDILHLSHREEIDRRIANPQLCLRDLYGGKGGGLIRISHAGVATRDGFILPTHFARSGAHERDSERFERELRTHLEILEQDIAQREDASLRFGDATRPLLLAVRAGSVFSMPGMLPTIVFVGMNDEVAEALAVEDPWYAYDAYRRFLTSWGGAVMGVNIERFDLVEEAKRRYGTRYKNELPWEAMRDVAERCKAILREKGPAELLDEALQSPRQQLVAAVRAVIAGWHSERAARYRTIKGLSDSWNTAVIIQQMASGNRRNAEVREGMDETRASLTGVIPNTMVTRVGLRRLTGDIKFSASGDDLVGGLTAADSFEPIERLRSLMPMLERALDHIGTRIRMQRGTDVELEFTVERGVLSVLQARTAATTLQEEVRAFDAPGEMVAMGTGIRGGAFRGRVAFDEADLLELASASRGDVDGVLLLLENPTPGEIPLILSAEGLLAARGGSTSHAAVAVHGIQDRPFSAVLGATALRVDAEAHCAIVQGADGREALRIEKGDVVSIDGRTGGVWIGSRSLLEVPAVDAGE